MRAPLLPLRLFALLIATMASPFAGGANLQERFLAYGERPPLPDETLLTEPEVLPSFEAPRYDDPALIFKSPLIVYLRFVVREDGTVSNVEVVVPSGREAYDEHIAAQFRTPDPRFKPGTVRGKPTAMPRIMAVTYVPPGKEEAFAKKKAAVRDTARALMAGVEQQIADLRAQARAKETAEREARQERYRQEAPYRYLPATPLSDLEMAKRFLQLKYLFTYCGAGVFHKWDDYIYEYAGGTGLEVMQSDLTSLDRLNGYEWRGRVKFNYGLVRTKHWSSREWDDWAYPPRNQGYLGIELEKKKGEWLWNWNTAPRGELVTCAEVLPNLE